LDPAVALGLDFAVGSDDHRGANSHDADEYEQWQYQYHDEPIFGYHGTHVRLMDANAIPM
jgi:hypothetical protein